MILSGETDAAVDIFFVPLKLVKAGKTHDEVIRGINKAIKKTEVYVVCKDLDYAVKGGRVNSTKKMITDFLNIKPIMSIKKDGSLGPTGFIWGQKNTIEKINKFIAKKINPNKKYDFAIGHSASEKDAEVLRKKLYENYSNIKSISILEIGCALGAHTGPGTLAVGIQEHLSI